MTWKWMAAGGSGNQASLLSCDAEGASMWSHWRRFADRAMPRPVETLGARRPPEHCSVEQKQGFFTDSNMFWCNGTLDLERRLRLCSVARIQTGGTAAPAIV